MISGAEHLYLTPQKQHEAGIHPSLRAVAQLPDFQTATPAELKTIFAGNCNVLREIIAMGMKQEVLYEITS
jgi:hypothetical protein